jgi:hypothetical protein
MQDTRVLPTDTLIPDEWRDSDPWVSNSCIIKRDDDSYTICYRVGSGKSFAYEHIGTPDAGRLRIACAVLDSDFNVVPGSVVALSDHIKFPQNPNYFARTITRHEDPRLFKLKDGLHITWNDGAYGKEPNHQFLLELDPTLRPIGHAQELIIERRRHDEKNWLIFDAEDGSAPKMVYSTSPLRILELAREEADALTFRDFSQIFWNAKPYQDKFGELRGGAAPARLGDHFYMFGHSSYHAPNGKRYVVSVVKFTAETPFRVIAATTKPLPFQNPLGSLGSIGKLTVPNVVEVIFPCGAFLDGDEWVISHGINEEACAITRIPHAVIEDMLIPVEQYGQLRGSIDRFQQRALRRLIPTDLAFDPRPRPCSD